MGLYKAEGIVLRARAYGEADSILTVYTKEYGKIQLMAKGARKTKSRKRGSVQPFCHSKFLIYTGKSLDTITQGDIVESFSYLVEDLDLITLSSYCCELVDNFSPEKEENLEMFYLLLQMFYYLPFTDKETITRAFELKLLNNMGYFPLLKACVQCESTDLNLVFFSAVQGGALCGKCQKFDLYRIPVTKGILMIMEKLLSTEFKKLKIFKITKEDKETLQRLTETYIRHLLEKKLKTIDILKAFNIKEPYKG